STAPLLTFLLTVHAAIYIDVSNGTCSPSFKLALASGFHIIAAMSDVTQLLNAIDTDDPKAADQLLPLVYEELRKLAAQRMAQEKPGQTPQATGLVHEAWLRLTGSEEQQVWNSRGHFFGAAAEAMRRILVNRARDKARGRHGGQLQRVDFENVDLAT